MPTVIATPISEEDGDRIRKALKDDSRAVLLSIADPSRIYRTRPGIKAEVVSER